VLAGIDRSASTHYTDLDLRQLHHAALAIILRLRLRDSGRGGQRECARG